MQNIGKFTPVTEPAELFILKVTAAILAVNACLIYAKNPEIDWPAYGGLTLVSVACFVGGQIYRVSNRSPRIGLALICTGIFPLFSWSIIMFNYLLMPTNRPPIDEALIWFDSLYGFHWPDYMAWGAANPVLSYILKLAYNSSVVQLALLIIVLGMTGRKQQLHSMMVSIVLTSVIAVLFWALFPTHGTSSYFTLAPGIEDAVNPPVTTKYGQELIRLFAEGPGLISPSNVKGLIGFPSYHIVLALTGAYFMRGVRGWFPLFLALNILVIFATPLHGGHHLADLLGGAILFVLGTVWAERLVSNMYRRDGQAPLLARETGQPVAA